MNRKACNTALLAICLMALAACSTNHSDLITPPPIVAIAAASGTPQSHAVNGTFGVPLMASVTTNGSPTSGMVVTFRAPTTGATGTFADTGNTTTTASTNSNGVATSATFTADGTAGAYVVTASVPGVTALADFNLTNTTAAPATITSSSTSGQSAGINTPFAPFVVVVKDSGGNPVSNAIVVFTAPATGASGTFADTGTITTMATTDASGTASSSVFTANGTSGTYMVTATVGTVSTTFTLTNAAGAATSIVVLSGTPQSAAIGTAFASPMVATVLDATLNPVSGVAVTFTAPTGAGIASGTFSSNGTATETDTTDSSGNATSSTFTADSVTGTYVVTATAAGVSTPVSFNLSNTVAFKTYVFFLNGQETNLGPDFYALAGAVKIDGSGNVIGGEQDYNDGISITSPEPSGDSITGGSLAIVDATTGQYTLTLNTNNPSLGDPSNPGVETLGLQFVNSSHALVVQFDGSATSSGSLDLQTLPTSLTGGYAFTLGGVDPFYQALGFGGVFTVSGGATLGSGVFDTNDAGTVTAGTAWNGTVSPFDSFGRGTLSGFTYSLQGSPQTVALNYYIVGPEVLRLIDVDTTGSSLGSAFGQGSNAGGAGNASLANSEVFGIAGGPFPTNYGAVGMFSTNSGAGTFAGVGDAFEPSLGPLPATPISGTYSIQSNGYGSLTIGSGSPLGDTSLLGVYVTDPNLNLSDPNNSSGRGGALIADMGPILAGGTGLLIPQTDNSVASFANTYAFEAQGFNFSSLPLEFDFVGQGLVASGTLSGTGLVSDPFSTFGGVFNNTGVTFSGSPHSDPSNLGRYTMFSADANPFQITVNGTPFSFDVVMYQASGNQLLWLNEDPNFITLFFGSLQQQGSLAGVPATRKVAPRLGQRRTRSTPRLRDVGY